MPAHTFSSDPSVEILQHEALVLLQQLIAIPSFSREEQHTAALIEAHLQSKGLNTQRRGHNVWAVNTCFDPSRPTLLLNSHHDTVKPNKGYSRDPFLPSITDGKLYGLGSNDAGGALVALMATFLFYCNRQNLAYNICYAATAEEEISGANGVASILEHLPAIDFAIVGEPTLMQLVVAEKGLMVLDCTVHGQAGHAARNEGDNALYKGLKDIDWFRSFQFPKLSDSLGPVKMSVTVIRAGEQHNVVPDTCLFTVDVRSTDAYSNEELLTVIRQHVSCTVEPRSLRLQPSSIALQHPVVQSGMALGRSTYGSPTTSDQALMPWPSLKMGPGDSARSHSADEYIYLSELYEGIALYIQLLSPLLNPTHDN